MNRRAMWKAKHAFAPFAAIALTLALTGCGQKSSGGVPADAPLAGAAIGGPFDLVDAAGKPVKWSDFDGKYRIVYFGYTYCPDVCPTDVGRIMQGFAKFKADEPELAAKVQPIFISIDPERDTPAKVGEFTHAFSDDLIGLTGTPGQVKAAAEAFKVFYRKGETSAGGGYLVDHSSVTYLMSPKGEPIALLPVDKGPDAVAADLARWVS
ncbi:SCO family protein [Altererythrobacter sp. CC-YST694]|uniref:SCO family protein n=1 Tax=Altererythrobacter sp. CC-YST694 TaxID=2755038 RepID=UPI001D01BD8E|nr:SCO family protein [Altererythrobacter sp. CC-YST694]